MKILLDEQLPVKLKYRLHTAITVFTVKDMQWLGLKDNELVVKINEHQFDYWITNDRNLKFQINIKQFNFSVIDLNFRSNRYKDLLLIVPALNHILLDLAGKISSTQDLNGRIFTLVNQELMEFSS